MNHNHFIERLFYQHDSSASKTIFFFFLASKIRLMVEISIVFRYRINQKFTTKPFILSAILKHSSFPSTKSFFFLSFYLPQECRKTRTCVYHNKKKILEVIKTKLMQECNKVASGISI